MRHIPANRSPTVFDGIITAIMNPHQADTIVNTGGVTSTCGATGTTLFGVHKSHCTISPGSYSVRSVGSTPANNGLISATFARNTDADRVHPTFSAITFAGIDGSAFSNSPIWGNNGSTAEPRGGLS